MSALANKNSIRLTLIMTMALPWLHTHAHAHHEDEHEAIAENMQRKAIKIEPIQPLQKPSQLDKRKVMLGRRLFYDTRLSKDNTVACATCHDLKKGGADNKRVSIGVGGAQGEINTPTVFNAANNFRQFWDGRAASLEDQIDGPINNPKEMASSWEEIIKKLAADAGYVKAFREAFDGPITATTIKSAIATFERSLITVNARFDRFLTGDKEALTADEHEGYETFKRLGCIACHQGSNIGSNMYQVFGVMGNYFADRGQLTHADLGRYNVTKQESDKHVFKVPSLRNVALTAPYFHDGSAATLSDAVRTMGKYQLGRQLSDKEIELVVAFLETLTGQYQGDGDSQ